MSQTLKVFQREEGLHSGAGKVSRGAGCNIPTRVTETVIESARFYLSPPLEIDNGRRFHIEFDHTTLV